MQRVSAPASAFRSASPSTGISRTRRTTASHFVSPATAAEYINWAEYLSWRSPRIATTMQFLLKIRIRGSASRSLAASPAGSSSSAASTSRRYDAYRMPLFLPSTRTAATTPWRSGAVCVPRTTLSSPRTAPQALRFSSSAAHVGAFMSLKTVRITNPRGYFDVQSLSRRAARSGSPGAGPARCHSRD